MNDEMLGYILQHWRDWCRSRRRVLHSLREPFQEWNSVTKQEKSLRECERIVRRALQSQRKSYILSECLAETTRRKLSGAAQAMQSVDNIAAWVPISDRLDKLLQKYEDRGVDATTDATQRDGSTPNDLQQLQTMPSHVYQGQTVEQPVLLDLMTVAGFAKHTLNEKIAVDDHLTETHYISTGVEENPLFSSLYSPPPPLSTQGAVPTDTDFLGMLDGYLFEDKENFLSQLQLQELATMEESTILSADKNTTSLIDSIASTAKSNLHKMTHEVHNSLIDLRGSQIHLSNYMKFIEKKKKQRVQCQRDLREHCCTCRGPHIAKPPFSHGKDYRREPTHEHRQNDRCTFIKKKKRELTWLDETIAKHNTNRERFEKEISMCEDETEKRKELLKDALANSLRLMEIAN